MRLHTGLCNLIRILFLVSFKQCFFQFHFKHNQRKQERKSKMESNDDSRMASYTDDESRLIRKGEKKPKALTDTEDAGQVRHYMFVDLVLGGSIFSLPSSCMIHFHLTTI